MRIYSEYFKQGFFFNPLEKYSYAQVSNLVMLLVAIIGVTDLLPFGRDKNGKTCLMIMYK